MNTEIDEDDFLYGEGTSQQAPQRPSSTTEQPKPDHPMEGEDEEEMSDDEEEEDSDSDIEFVIETEPGKRAAPPPSAQPFAVRLPSQARPAATPERVTSTANQIKAETSTATPAAPVEGVDIDKVAEYNGKPLFELDLESLEEKPWRKPGADVTDYFNYGFDEFTWTAYCAKQTNLRKEFNPANVMAQMTGMPPEMQAMMTQFPMAPEMMFGAMGMMDPNAFAQQGGFGAGYGQASAGPSGQQQFGGYGGFPQQQQQQPPQQQGYGQQYGVPQGGQQQLQPPKYPNQRMGSPARMGSPNAGGINIPSGPQAMSGQNAYWGGQNGHGSMRGAPRGGQRRY